MKIITLIRTIKKYNIWILTVVGFFILACNNNVIDKSSDKPNQEKKENSISKTFSKRDSINEPFKWKKLNCGLWINKNNEIGLKAFDSSDPLEGYPGEIFLTRIKGVQLSDIVDTSSFQSLGNRFYKDKNNIYHHYNMSDGGFLSLRPDIDNESFKVIHDCYAKDKNSVYEYKGRKIAQADVTTFKVDRKIDFCFAKDKNHYYQWGDKLSKEEMKDSIVMEAIKILNK